MEENTPEVRTHKSSAQLAIGKQGITVKGIQAIVAVGIFAILFGGGYLLRETMVINSNKLDAVLREVVKISLLEVRVSALEGEIKASRALAEESKRHIAGMEKMHKRAERFDRMLWQLAGCVQERSRCNRLISDINKL